MLRRCIFAALILLNTGCVGLRQYRTQPSTEASSLSDTAIIEVANRYKLGFVEVDDQGWLFSRRQFEYVLAEIERENAAGPTLLVAFVHGWKHNASHGDGNVITFRKNLEILEMLERAGSARDHRTPRKIFGVYIGWRGQSSRVPLLNNLTFWERKNAAHEVGRGALAEIFLRLDACRHIQRELQREKSTQTRLVIIGHSFGGAATYSATGPLLLQQIIEPEVPGLTPGVGDLTILINPAFEASRVNPLREAALAQRFATNQPVRLAIFTSRTDLATKTAFPIGRNVSTVFDSYISSTERKANKTAIGHFSPFQTHQLRIAKDSAIDHEPELAKQVLQGKAKPTTLRFGEYDLIPAPHFPQGFPIYNVYVDSEIIKNHGDIDNRNFVRFLTAFFTEVLD